MGKSTCVGVLSINHTNIIQHFVCQNTLQKVKRTSALFFFSCVCVGGGGGGGGFILFFLLGGGISKHNNTQNKRMPRIHFGDSCVFQCLNYYFTESVHKGIN